MMKCLYLVSVVFHVAAGCALSANNDQVGHKIRRRGDSVLLPCSCSDLNTKPQTLTWWTYRTGNATEVLNDEHYRGRLQLFNNISPANLSLFISDLRVEDQGYYRCSTEKAYRDIRLNVKVKRETSTRRKTKTKSPSKQRQSKTTHSPPASPSALDQGRRETSTHLRKTDTAFTSEQPHSKTTHSPPASSSTTPNQDKGQMHNSLPLGILAVLLLVIVAFICWRCRGGRCGDNTITERCQGCKKKQKTDAIYANVSHNNKAGAAQVQINTGEETEYACIKKTTAKKKVNK
ncbi:uncharacterized protein Hap1MRO34_001371 [Clarias gariepinus]|uniref:uncharacterized protein LOC128544826 n=1 Tax=Clarias gariepinus TaxID=13013 RepID=UPI00234CA923|nr:uncharacterized protein LOC128544826 [Clarias gariepinus]